MQAPTTRRLNRPVHLLHISAAAVLAALIGLGSNGAQAHPTQPQAERAAPHRAHQRMADGMGLRGVAIPERLLDKVGASADQKARLREIAKAASEDLRSQRAARLALRQQMQAVLAAPQVDAAAAEALRQQQLARQDASSKRVLQAMLDAQAVLTPEQRAQIAQHRADRLKNMPERRRGHGGHAPAQG